MSGERFYAVRLLWVRDREAFAQYQEMAKPILAKHGVHVERWLATKDMEGTGMAKPDEIVVTWFKDAAAKDEFEKDPGFKKAKEVRDRAARLVTITAESVFGD